MRYAYAFLACSYAALAVAVAAGVFTGVDQWAVDHAMPGAHFQAGEASLVDALVPLHHTYWSSGWSIAVNVVTLPASFLVALALTWWLSRPIAVVLVIATAVETLSKHLLERPELHHGGRVIAGFTDSFPSGHTLRAVLVAAAVARPFGTAWALASFALLELAGWHTPTDIAGGVLLGALALLCARALGGRRLLGGRS